MNSAKLPEAAHGKIEPDLLFSAPQKWPPLEPPAIADEHWNGFARQGPSGRNILEDWRRRADATIAALFARVHGG